MHHTYIYLPGLYNILNVYTVKCTFYLQTLCILYYYYKTDFHYCIIFNPILLNKFHFKASRAFFYEGPTYFFIELIISSKSILPQMNLRNKGKAEINK